MRRLLILLAVPLLAACGASGPTVAPECREAVEASRQVTADWAELESIYQDTIGLAREGLLAAVVANVPKMEAVNVQLADLADRKEALEGPAKARAARFQALRTECLEGATT